MSQSWHGEDEDARAAAASAAEHDDLVRHTSGEPIRIGNEFSDISVRRVETRNGARLLIESPKSGQWVSLCPLELEALTWQNTATFSAMIGHPFGSLISDDDQPDGGVEP